MMETPLCTALVCLLVFGTSTEALFAASRANMESSTTQTCARELHTVAPNCVTSMFADVQTLKAEIASVKNVDEMLKSDLDAEHKTVAELRKEVDYLSLRITEGTEYRGTAEIYVRGRWGTICDAGWDQRDADLFCNMMGFESGSIWLPTRSSLPYLMSNMGCDGDEKSIFDCEHTDLSTASLCPTGHVATVKCEIAIRVVGGPDDKHGRVEISHRGEWGTICDNGWDDKDASVVCKMLGHSDGGRAEDMAVFGAGTGRILLSKVNCTGTETSILDCPKPYFGLHECTHGEDASVVCY